MKKKRTIFFIAAACFALSFKLSAQNADEIIFNTYQSPNNYVAASFVIDTGISQVNAKRAFLIWANNLKKDSTKRNFSLSEYDGNLNFLTEQGGTAERNGNVKNMFPKKIIKSKFAHVYYLLAYTTNSKKTTGGFNVYSSPVVYKIDGNLNIIWSSKLNLSAITPNNLNTVIEYNDMIETSDRNIVLVGKYAGNTQAQEFVLATKLKGTNGAIVWRYKYNAGEKCNEAANSVAETTDKKLSLTGYVKKCTIGFNGNSDAFYMELQSTGIPVPGVYIHYVWGANLNLWADKITLYTSSLGGDQLIISGYVDILTNNITDRQILVMNIKQSGFVVTMQHVGDPKTDVCNDLIVTRNGNLPNDYLIYLTGQTSNYNSQASVSGEAYFMFAKFNSNAGIISLGEFSTFPVTTPPYNAYRSRTGVEIKNAGSYKKFAILATGIYQPTANTSATYSNVLIRDFADVSGNCIKQFQPPVKQFNVDIKQATVAYDTPSLKVYGERWIKLSKLAVKELCQEIKVDPNDALNLKQETIIYTSQQKLKVNPNPANAVINLSMIDGSVLAGKNKNAVVRIYNSAMQLEKIVAVNIADKTISIPVAQLNQGVYMIQLIRGDEKLSGSFIKE